MPFTDSDWNAIQQFVTHLVSQTGEYFTQGKVVKNDSVKKLVWLTEFGDQPIPLIAFDYQVKTYYEAPAGNTTTVGSAVNSEVRTRKTRPYTREVEVLVPQIGDIVLIARHMGSRRLPKCLGVIKSTGYVDGGGGSSGV